MSNFLINITFVKERCCVSEAHLTGSSSSHTCVCFCRDENTRWSMRFRVWTLNMKICLPVRSPKQFFECSVCTKTTVICLRWALLEISQVWADGSEREKAEITSETFGPVSLYPDFILVILRFFSQNIQTLFSSSQGDTVCCEHEQKSCWNTWAPEAHLN